MSPKFAPISPHDIDSSYHFTEEQSKDANEMQQDCFNAFLHDHELDAATDYRSKYATDLYTKTYSATQFKKLSAEDIIKRIKY